MWVVACAPLLITNNGAIFHLFLQKVSKSIDILYFVFRVIDSSKKQSLYYVNSMNWMLRFGDRQYCGGSLLYRSLLIQRVLQAF